MITIPLYPFLFIYGFLLLAVAALFFVNVGHLIHTGTLTIYSFFATFIFLALSVIILWFTWQILGAINWQQPIVVWNSAWLGENSFPQY